MKDKTFFYVNYEGQREKGAQSGTSCVPDPAVDCGDGGQHCRRRRDVNPVTQALLALNPWPTPNISGATSDESWMLHQ